MRMEFFLGLAYVAGGMLIGKVLDGLGIDTSTPKGFLIGLVVVVLFAALINFIFKTK